MIIVRQEELSRCDFDHKRLILNGSERSFLTMKTLDEIRDAIKKMCKEDIEGNKSIDKSIDAQRRLSLYSQLLAVVEKTALEETKKAAQVYDKIRDEMMAAAHKVADPVINKLLNAQEKGHSGDSRYTAAIERLRKEFNRDNY